MATRRRIRLLAMGGTIASVPTASAPGGGVTPTLTSEDLIRSVPGLADVAEIEAVDFPRVAGFEVTPAHMRDLAAAVEQARADGCDGVVVTHGTDGIEETGYGLALMAPRACAMVLAGAMRVPSMVSADGAANLLSAFRVAASDAAPQLGVVLTLGDEIHAARFATKTHTSKPSTFASPGAGPLGEVIEGRVDTWFRPAWEDHLGLPATLDGVDVPVVSAQLGGGDAMLRAAIALRPSGIVVAGTGAGHVPSPLAPAVSDAVEAGIPVVIASRLVSGSTCEDTYGMAGGEIDLMQRGAIMAGRLPAHKARVRLIVGLALGLDPRAIFPVR